MCVCFRFAFKWIERTRHKNAFDQGAETKDRIQLKCVLFVQLEAGKTFNTICAINFAGQPQLNYGKTADVVNRI